MCISNVSPYPKSLEHLFGHAIDLKSFNLSHASAKFSVFSRSQVTSPIQTVSVCPSVEVTEAALEYFVLVAL